MIKKLDTFIFRSFFGPFISGFVIVLFILVLQFLSRYIEDLVGKNLEAIVLFKVVYYCGLFLLTTALPLAVLLSSLMTMGNMGERYELVALKSAGISLFQILRPMLVFTFGLTLISMYFSFYLAPSANLKFFSLLFDLNKVKPSFALKAGHFYSGIDGFTIHVGDVDRTNDMLHKVKIFDHSDRKRKGHQKIILADSAKMYGDPNGHIISMRLFSGITHQKFPPDKGEKTNDNYARFYFDTLNYHFILEGFKIQENNQMNFSPHHFMKNIEELYVAVDSMDIKVLLNEKRLGDYIEPLIKTDSSTRLLYPDPDCLMEPGYSVLHNFDEDKWPDILSRALSNSRTIQNYTKFTQDRSNEDMKKKRKYLIEFLTRIMLPLSCLVFLLIGAPLGAIVRKGGVGLPVIFSVMFFIIFYVMMIQGKKLAEDGIVHPAIGVFLPFFVLIPMAIILTYQSATDSRLLDLSIYMDKLRFLVAYINPFNKNDKD